VRRLRRQSDAISELRRGRPSAPTRSRPGEEDGGRARSDHGPARDHEKTVADVAAVLEKGDAIIDGGNSYYRTTFGGRPRSARGHRLHRLRNQRWSLRPRPRLLPDDRRPDEASSASPDLLDDRTGVEAAERTPGRDGDPDHCRERLPALRPEWRRPLREDGHNGIEYGVMAAYAEGLNILKHADARQGEARSRRRDRPPRPSAVLPVRPRHPRDRRGLATAAASSARGSST